MAVSSSSSLLFCRALHQHHLFLIFPTNVLLRGTWPSHVLLTAVPSCPGVSHLVVLAVLVVLCMGVGCPPFSWFCVVSLTGTCSADCVLAAIVLVWMLAIEKWFGCACSRVLPSLLLTFQFHVKFLFLLLGYLPCFWFTPPKTQMCQTLLLLMNDKPVELIAVLLRKKT